MVTSSILAEHVDVAEEAQASASESQENSSLEIRAPKDVLSDVSSSVSSSVSSLLSTLRPPPPMVLAHKRWLQQNPPKGVKRGKGKENRDPNTISPVERLRAYPNKELMVRNSKLFCRTC